MRKFLLHAVVCASAVGCAPCSFSQNRITDARLDGVISGMEATRRSGRADHTPDNNLKSANYIGFDAILSGMQNSAPMNQPAKEIDLSAVMGAMQSEIDFDEILTSMEADRNLISSVTESITVFNTLDFMIDTYTKPTGFLTASWNPSPDYRHSVLPGGRALPVSGRITSRFGYRPKFHRQHKGVDIALNIGDTVCAAMDGTVTRVDFERKGYGLFVVLKHDNGFETRYAHLSHTLVWPGMTVRAGQPVALGGNSGNSTGPHLHFEIRANNEALDPLTMFDFSKPAINPEWNTAETYYADSRSDANFARLAAVTASGKSTYVVRTGDTIASVSKSTGIPVMKLCNLNMLAPTDPLTPGRMLRLR